MLSSVAQRPRRTPSRLTPGLNPMQRGFEGVLRPNSLSLSLKHNFKIRLKVFKGSVWLLNKRTTVVLLGWKEVTFSFFSKIVFGHLFLDRTFPELTSCYRVLKNHQPAFYLGKIRISDATKALAKRTDQRVNKRRSHYLIAVLEKHVFETRNALFDAILAPSTTLNTSMLQKMMGHWWWSLS